MNQKRDDNGGTGEHEQPSPEVTNKPDENLTLVIELGSPEKEPARAEYKEGRLYKRTYLVTQIIMAAVTFIGILVAVCTLKDINKNVADSHTQAVAAATQAATAQQQLRLSERPWISADAEYAARGKYCHAPPIEPVKKKFHGMVPIDPISIDVTMKNYGISVASDAKVFAIGIYETDNWENDLKRLTAAADNICEGTANGGQPMTLFPNNPDCQSFGIPPPTKMPDEFFIIGCVTYGDPIKQCVRFDDCHWTRFAYEWQRQPKPHMFKWFNFNEAH